MCWVSYNPPLPSHDAEWHAHASLIDHIWVFLTLGIHSGIFFFVACCFIARQGEEKNYVRSNILVTSRLKNK